MENENSTQRQNDNEFDREQFEAVVKDALQQAKKIGEAYRKYFESGQEDKPSIFADIESRLEAVIQKYNELFVSQSDGGASKVTELGKQVEEIKKYHKELLANEGSIKADIQESQDKITKFYIYLFGGEGNPNGEEEKVRKAIEGILDFKKKLDGDSGNPGYVSAIEEAHKMITELYSEVFSVSEAQEQNKADTLRDQIKDIGEYHKKLEDEVKPFIQDTKKQIQEDKKSVKALLGSAIGPSLLEGFLESKREYKQVPKYFAFEKNESRLDSVRKGLANVTMWIGSKLVIFLNYTFFIAPLLLSVIVILGIPEKFQGAGVLGVSTKFISNFFSSATEKGVGIFIVLPLWWIAWFGHRNLSQSKRMAEEYNHKAQVTRMYIKFTADDESNKYPLSVKQKEKLYDELINVIARHSGEVFGRDETLLDKVLHLAAAWKGVRLDEDGRLEKESQSKT